MATWSDELRQRYPGVEVKVEERPGGWLLLETLVIPASDRGRGRGSAVMRDLIAYADEHGLKMALVPAGDYGGSPRRLRQFYARFGFEKPGKAIPSEVVYPASGAATRAMVRGLGVGRGL